MALTVEELIKIGLGFLVVVLVVVGISFFSKNNVIEFIRGIGVGDKPVFFRILIK
jgi:hypothetical protein